MEQWPEGLNVRGTILENRDRYKSELRFERTGKQSILIKENKDPKNKKLDAGKYSEPCSSTAYMQIFAIKPIVLVPGSGIRYT